MLLKCWDAFGGFMGASWQPEIRRGGQGAEKQAGVCCASCSALQFSGPGLCVSSDALSGEARKPLMHMHVKVDVAAEIGWS